MTVQVRSWILLGPSVLHACSGAHVASCRVVFRRPLIADVLAPAAAHLLMGGRSTWRSVPHDALQLLFSRSFPRQPWRLPGAFDLGVGVNWWWCSRLHLPCCVRHPSAVAVPWLQTVPRMILSCLRSARWLLWLPSPRHPPPMDEEPPGWCHFFPIRKYISGGNHCSRCRCHNRKTADL